MSQYARPSDPRSSGPKPFRGAVAIIRRDSHYLMIRRAATVVAGGAWCFPGGAIEAGESSAEAIVREVAEELGLAGQAIEQLWSWTRDHDGLILDWWRVEVMGSEPEPNPEEVAEARWMTEEEIRSTPGVLPGLLEFLDRFGDHTSPDSSSD